MLTNLLLSHLLIHEAEKDQIVFDFEWINERFQKWSSSFQLNVKVSIFLNQIQFRLASRWT
jgi:hypothetical protein